MKILLVVALAFAVPASAVAGAEEPGAPSPKSLELLRATRTARVEFAGVEGPGATTANLPVEATAWKLLAHGGLGRASAQADLVVRITLRTEAPPQTHNVQVMNAPIGTMELVVRYTRASMSGKIELQPAGGEPVWASFDGSAEDPYPVPESRMSDIDAPFEEAFANVFLPRLLATMTRYLGQEILTGALSDQDADIRAAAFKLAASSAAGNPAAIEPLIPSLTDSTETIRRAAYQAIVSMREAAAPPLIARLKDPNPALRAAVVDVLREVGGRAAIDAVVAALSDPATQVRDAAIISISSLTYDAKLESLQLAVEPLLRIATGDPDAATRRHAVEVLPRLRDPRSIEPLIAILEGADASLRATAGAALQELTGQRFGLNAKKWRQWLAKTRQ